MSREIVDVRAERLRRGLSLPELAKRADVSYHVARRLERGLAIREDSAKRIADILGCEVIDFAAFQADEREAA